MKRVFSAITRASINFRWVTILLAVAALVGGAYAATRLNQELLPNISFPQTYVFALQPGASSEDLLALITLPLEQEVVKIKGVVREGLQSTTTSPAAFLTIVNESGIEPASLRDQIAAAINKVVAEGVPQGLNTTADLTSEIVTRVLAKAPSMWAHFTSAQLLAMPSDVLDAALKVDPAFATSLDPLTRDQLAAERVDAAVNGTKLDKRPADLPGAWKITPEKLPRPLTFNLSSLPIITASISSPDLSSEALRNLVEKEMRPELEKITGVAKGGITISGGQQIPQEVLDAAAAAIARAAQPTAPAAPPTAAPTAAPAQAAQSTPAATSAAAVTPAAQTPIDANGVPLVPNSWKNPLTTGIIRNLLKVPVATADDLFKAKDASGNTLTAAQAINALAEKNGYLLRDLTPGFIQYVVGKEPDFVKNLSTAASAALSAEAVAAATGGKAAPALASVWTTLANRAGYKARPLITARDLANLPGGAAAAINAIVKNTPTTLASFAISVASSLTPETAAYLASVEPDFLRKLDPQVLRYLSAETLKSLPAEFIPALTDNTLKTELQAIIADPSKAASAQLKGSTGGATIPDDPTAPKLPDIWVTQLKGFGVTVTKADDLLRKPAGQSSAAAFINLLARNGGATFMGPLSAEVLIYLQAKDPTFYAALDVSALSALSKETLAKLPREVQDRASAGVPFTPTNTITRVNGEQSLTVSVSKEDTANTVNAAEGVEAYFKGFQAKHPNVRINPTFEQAGFIRESISGVAREGGLGAVMAVIVILLFLNFSFRSTLVTAVSIPTSVGIAFVFMAVLPPLVHPAVVASALPDTLKVFLLRLFPAQITLNIMTLSGLTVAIGRVVDDSIVVLENIYRQIQAGGDPRKAVLTGTRDVSLAIFAATVTTVVVFLPIGLSGGIIGEFFLPFGLAVTYSLLASFVVAITIVPLLALLFIRPQDVPQEKEGRLEHLYQNGIQWALGHRVIVLAVALVTLIFGVALFGSRPTTFLPSFGEPQVSVSVSLPGGTTIAQTDTLVRRFEDYLKANQLEKNISKYQVNIGGGSGLASFITAGSVSQNAATITLAPKVKGDALTALTGVIRTQAEQVFGQKNVKVSKASLTEQGFGGFALVASGSADLLTKTEPQIIKTLSTVPGLTNVTSSASQAAGSGSTTFLRINQAPALQFTGELETNDTLGLTRKAIAAVKADTTIPAEIKVGEGYQSQQQTQGFAQTFGSLGLAILIVYIVMVITFSSVVHPFTILFSLPLAVVGAALGLTLTNRVLGISALIGLLMLVGIVVTNAIVLIDRVQQNRKEKHMATREALIEAGRTRLRPILMTAIATMIALLPLAIGLSEGAIIAAELGTVVIGGLFSSTLLTLLVVPVVYSLLDGLIRRLFGRGSTPEASSKPQVAPGN